MKNQLEQEISLSSSQEQHLKHIVYKHLKLDDHISEEYVDQKNVGNWTSARHVSIIIELEEFFNIQFGIDEITSMKSYMCLYRCLANKLSAWQ